MLKTSMLNMLDREVAIMIREEEVDALAAWAEEAAPVGLPAFDRAWALVRRDRAHVPAQRCPTSRLLVHRFLDELKRIRDDRHTEVQAGS